MKKIQTIFIFLAVFVFSVIISSAQKKEFSNPILAGFYPDPSICRVGNDYYLVNSSFDYYPGLPVFHCTDLVSWQQIGYAMSRPEQLNLAGAGVSRGLFAPAIRYHKGIFYITCTLVDKGGNFVITAKNPAGPWSNPVWLPQVNGIDPSLFFDDDKAYIVYNSVPPENKSLYNGHRTIRMHEFDIINLKSIGEEEIIVNGGTDISKKPVWIEGPHIFKKDGWYYLICAEGGTEYNHSEVVFRSKNVDGPYISYENNPILTQRNLDPKRKNPITSTGHADFVETTNGKWYSVFLGCRPYEEDHYNTGRETFIAPVTWKNGWPVINEGNNEMQYHYPLPLPEVNKYPMNSFSGNLLYHDDFNKSQLAYRWEFLRTVTETWYSTKEKKGFLTLKLRPQTCSGTGNPSFIAHRQQNLKCSASTSLLFSPQSENEKAGLIIFQNEHHFYFLCESIENSKKVIQLYKSTANENMELITSQPLPADKQILLKIEAKASEYAFYFSTNNKIWQLLKDGVDAEFLSTKTAGGFVGSMFALYATSLGKESQQKASFDWFDYKGNDDIYK